MESSTIINNEQKLTKLSRGKISSSSDETLESFFTYSSGENSGEDVAQGQTETEKAKIIYGDQKELNQSLDKMEKKSVSEPVKLPTYNKTAVEIIIPMLRSDDDSYENCTANEVL